MLREHSDKNVVQLAQHIRSACERVDSLDGRKLPDLTLMLFIDESDHHKLRENLSTLQKKTLSKA